MELTKEEIRRLALARARDEFPEVREQVRQMYRAKRWNRYWGQVESHAVARAAASVERGS